MQTPFKQPADGQVVDVGIRAYNTLLRWLRSLGERAFTLLSGRWRAPRHITPSPRKIGTINKAALVLTHVERAQLN